MLTKNKTKIKPNNKKKQRKLISHFKKAQEYSLIQRKGYKQIFLFSAILIFFRRMKILSKIFLDIKCCNFENISGTKIKNLPYINYKKEKL